MKIFTDFILSTSKKKIFYWDYFKIYEKYVLFLRNYYVSAWGNNKILENKFNKFYY